MPDEPASTLTPLRDSLLAEAAGHGGLTLTVCGSSMEPLLAAGARVQVARRRLYLPGDIVAFRSPGGAILLHRLIGYRRLGGRLHLLLQGDRASAPDCPCPPEQVLGRLAGGEAPAAALRVPLAHRLRALGRFVAWGTGALRRRLRRRRGR